MLILCRCCGWVAWLVLLMATAGVAMGATAFKVSVIPQPRPGAVRLRANVERIGARPPLSGQVILNPAGGGVAGVFFPVPQAPVWVLELTTSPPGPGTMRVLLTGATPEGEPVLWQAPVLEIPRADERVGGRWGNIWDRVRRRLGQVTGAPARLWESAAVRLGLGVLGAALLGLGAGMFLGRRQRPGPEGGDDVINVDHLPPAEAILLLKAQVEALSKGKAALEEALAGLREESARLHAEKTQMAGELERQRALVQEKTQACQQLAQEVERVQQDARAMQQEYMALYARSGQDRSNLRKE